MHDVERGTARKSLATELTLTLAQPTSTTHSQAARDFQRRMSEVRNVGAILSVAAAAFPDIVAVAEAPRQINRGRDAYPQLTFGQLENWATRIAAGLQQANVPAGTRLALMVRPGIDFVALVFGLMKAGLVSILIDPGMGKRNLVRCLSEADPQGFIGIAKAQWLRVALARKFRQARFNFGVGVRWPGLPSINSFRRLEPNLFREPPIGLDDPAAFIFTTGSTGPPKGVLYRHRNFVHQAIEIGRYFGFPPGTVDISGFPLFALFNAATATTTVFPRMDFTRPASVEPRQIISAANDWSATQSFGSPALWNTVARYCQRRGVRLPTIRNVLTAGAPVPAHVLAGCKSIIASDGEVHTPYGATEALPIACISASEVLAETAAQTAQGRGTCVGRAFPEIQWHVIQITDQPIADISQAVLLPGDEIGELIVRGPVVTDRYVTRTEANALHKIADGAEVWHRMGDVGYLDIQNRFWFCGRKSHRVQTAEGTMFTIPCEAIYNQHPAIYRSALVGIGSPGRQEPVIVAEPWPEHWPRNKASKARLVAELQQMGQASELTKSIRRIYLRKSLPVDIRHNAKIFRERLAEWVAKQ